jgi:RNA polymerase sigma-70 factor (ECF subfamily)
MTVHTGEDVRSDEQLLAAFVRGEDAALGVLAGRHERAMVGYAAGMLGGDEAKARDAVQETWVRVIRHAGTFRGKAAAKTWIYRILINRCREVTRRQRRRGEVVGDVEPGAGPGGDAGAGDGPARAVSRDLLARVRAALGEMTPDRREVVLLCHHRGMTHREAAAALQIPVGTVKTRLYAAMDELRAILGVEARNDG